MAQALLQTKKSLGDYHIFFFRKMVPAFLNLDKEPDKPPPPTYQRLYDQ
jgi:hypothetical protein